MDSPDKQNIESQVQKLNLSLPQDQKYALQLLDDFNYFYLISPILLDLAIKYDNIPIFQKLHQLGAIKIADTDYINLNVASWDAEQLIPILVINPFSHPGFRILDYILSMGYHPSYEDYSNFILIIEPRLFHTIINRLTPEQLFELAKASIKKQSLPLLKQIIKLGIPVQLWNTSLLEFSILNNADTLTIEYLNSKGPPFIEDIPIDILKQNQVVFSLFRRNRISKSKKFKFLF